MPVIQKQIKVPSISFKNESNLSRELNQILGKEITDISKPCYYPKLIKYFSDIKNKTNITSSTIREFTNELKPYHNISILNDEYTKVILLCYLNLIQKNKITLSKDFFRFLTLKFYSSIMHKHFPKYCNQDVWVIAMDSLSIKHLFKIKNGIGTSLIYLSDIIFDKYKLRVKNDLTLDTLIKLVYELRHRISQSTKSFAQLYHKLQERGGIEGTKKEMEESFNVTLIADKYSMIMCTYGQIDKIALSESILKTGFRKDLAISTITSLSSPEFKDQIRFIIILIGRLGNLHDVCIDRKRNLLLRKINSNKKVDKYLVKDQIKILMYSTEQGHNLKTLAESQVIMFFSHYLLNFLKNRIC